METFIINENYYITVFDLILLSNFYKIPLTMISSTTYKENKKEYLSLNIESGKTYIIRTPTINKYTPTLPKYRMIINKLDEGIIGYNRFT